MGRLATVAPVVIVALAWASFPASAQRGSAHGGFSGHSAPAFHGSFSVSGPAFRGFSPGAFANGPRYGFTTPPRYYFSTPWGNRLSPSPRYFAGGNANFAPRFAGNTFSSPLARSVYPGASQQRTIYRPPYTRGDRSGHNHSRRDVPWDVWPYNYGLAVYPDFYLYPPLWDDQDSDDSSDESQGYAPQQPSPQDYGSGSPQQQQPEYPALPPWPYGNGAQNVPQWQTPAQAATPPQPAEAVTIVFNDGRPAVTIHNYLLTASTLYVMDKQRREIPVDELDLAVTTKVNREAGVDFSLPVSPK